MSRLLNVSFLPPRFLWKPFENWGSAPDPAPGGFFFFSFFRERKERRDGEERKREEEKEGEEKGKERKEEGEKKERRRREKENR